tara:strand:+ start:191 stop:394 length:204 start_codon:yes stop_codon:yes gene_type:complete
MAFKLDKNNFNFGEGTKPSPNKSFLGKALGVLNPLGPAKLIMDRINSKRENKEDARKQNIRDISRTA